MIIYCDSGGKVTSVPSTLPFGSAPEIAIVSQKMAATAILKIKQPNQGYLPDIICAPEVGTDGMIYRAQLPQSVTNTHGRAEYQVIFVLVDGEQVGTYAGTFNVARGVQTDIPTSEEMLKDYAINELYQLLSNVGKVNLLADALNIYTGIGTVLETDGKNLAEAVNELHARPIFVVDKTLTIEGQAADAKATGEKIKKSLEEHNNDGTAHAGILEKLDDLDTDMLNVKSDVDTLKKTSVTTDKIVDAVNAHNQAESAHPALKSSINEVADKVNNLDVDGKIEDALFGHNTNQEAHQYILDLVNALNTKIGNFFDAANDNGTLDRLSELITAIEENAESIGEITVTNVKYTDIADRLDDPNENRVLSAKQGVVLMGKIAEVEAQIAETKAQIGTQINTAINYHDTNAASHHGLREMVEDVGDRVTVLENKTPEVSGDYVTKAELETVLGSYITDLDNLVGGGIEGGESGGEVEPSIITFTIDGVGYAAKPNMTWGEWVASSHNTGGYVVSNGYINNANGSSVQKIVGGFVHPSDTIEASWEYLILGGSN